MLSSCRWNRRTSFRRPQHHRNRNDHGLGAGPRLVMGGEFGFISDLNSPPHGKQPGWRLRTNLLTAAGRGRPPALLGRRFLPATPRGERVGDSSGSLPPPESLYTHALSVLGRW